MKNLLWILLFCLPLMTWGQTQELQNTAVLASQYYQEKEYGKAAELYGQLYEATRSEGYFNIYLDCLLAIQDYDTAEKSIKKGLKGNSSDAYWHVQWGFLKKAQGQAAESEKMYDRAIESVGNNALELQSLSNQFINRREFAYAEKVYIKARNGNPGIYNYELGRIYYYLRNYELMLKEYMEWAREKETNLEIVKSTLQSVLSTDNDQEISNQMKAYVLKRIQEDPSQLLYTRLLIWLFIQEKNFAAATRQAISLDKRTGQEDAAIFSLATVSATNKNYNEAVKAYDYLIGKGKTAEYYHMAMQQRMEMYYERFVDGGAFDREKAQEVKAQFLQTFETIGLTAESASLQTRYAHLLAFYLNEPAQAISVLTKGLALPRLNPQQAIQMKTELADVYVFSGELWDAVITYSQVIEGNKNNPASDEVKFKKARLGYLMGNFKWAKAQLDVLKASTSKLIANDAMELALFISENLEEDSLDLPLQLFARADLHLFRNDHPQALAVLDSVSTLYPENSLNDDVNYRKAEILQKEAKYEEAAAVLSSLVKNHSWEMLADDALFELARLYETKLNRKAEAMDLYKKMLTDYPGSVFVVDARTAYRTLQQTTGLSASPSLETKPEPLKTKPDSIKTNEDLFFEGIPHRP